MHDAKTSIADFLAATAARQPAPGGGSVSALTGAVAAAIGEMVVNYSAGKKSLAAFEPQLKSALKQLARAREMLLELMVEDQTAYEALTAARKLPETDATRGNQQSAALLESIRVPHVMAGAGLAVLDLADRLVPIVNPFLLSDLAVCSELSMATIRCAIYNVRVNLKDLKDPKQRAYFETSLTSVTARATTLIQRIIPAIWARDRQP